MAVHLKLTLLLLHMLLNGLNKVVVIMQMIITINKMRTYVEHEQTHRKLIEDSSLAAEHRCIWLICISLDEIVVPFVYDNTDNYHPLHSYLARPIPRHASHWDTVSSDTWTFVDFFVCLCCCGTEDMRSPVDTIWAAVCMAQFCSLLVHSWYLATLDPHSWDFVPSQVCLGRCL